MLPRAPVLEVESRRAFSERAEPESLLRGSPGARGVAIPDLVEQHDAAALSFRRGKLPPVTGRGVALEDDLERLSYSRAHRPTSCLPKLPRLLGLLLRRLLLDGRHRVTVFVKEPLEVFEADQEVAFRAFLCLA